MATVGVKGLDKIAPSVAITGYLSYTSPCHADMACRPPILLWSSSCPSSIVMYRVPHYTYKLLFWQHQASSSLYLKSCVFTSQFLDHAMIFQNTHAVLLLSSLTGAKLSAALAS